MSTITDSTKNIFGYVTFYLKYTSNDSVYYAKFCSDFKPPISEALFLSVLERVKTIYEQQYGQTLTGCFCSKEEYEDHDDNRAETAVTWESDEQGNVTTTVKNPQMLERTADWIYEIHIGLSSKHKVLYSVITEEDAVSQFLQMLQTPNVAEPQKVSLIRKRYRNGICEKEEYRYKENGQWFPLK